MNLIVSISNLAILLSGLIPIYMARHRNLSLCGALNELPLMDVTLAAVIGATGYMSILLYYGNGILHCVPIFMGYILMFVMLAATYNHDTLHLKCMIASIVFLQIILSKLPHSTLMDFVFGIVIPITSILTWRHLNICFDEEKMAVVLVFFFTSYCCPFLFMYLACQ